MGGVASSSPLGIEPRPAAELLDHRLAAAVDAHEVDGLARLRRDLGGDAVARGEGVVEVLQRRAAAVEAVDAVRPELQVAVVAKAAVVAVEVLPVRAPDDHHEVAAA